MKISNAMIKKGFVISGLMSFSVLFFSKFFTNDVIAEVDPAVMSNFGLVMILLWGLAYISVANNFQNVKWLVAVFALEKLIYGAIWINWQLNNSLAEVYDKDLFAGMFYSVYGINDLIFFVFFSLVFASLIKDKAGI